MADELFAPSPDDMLVTLELAPTARWVTETYPLEAVNDVLDRLRAGAITGRAVLTPTGP